MSFKKILFLPRESISSVWKMFPCNFFKAFQFFFQSTEKKKWWRKQLHILKFPCLVPDRQTFKQPAGAQQKCCTSRVVIGRVAGWSMWQLYEKAKTDGVTLPLPLHSPGSCCGNTPVPWRDCDCAWLTLRIHSDERFFWHHPYTCGPAQSLDPCLGSVEVCSFVHRGRLGMPLTT